MDKAFGEKSHGLGEGEVTRRKLKDVAAQGNMVRGGEGRSQAQKHLQGNILCIPIL